MRVKTVQWIFALTLAGVMAGPLPLAAQEPKKHDRYILVDMGTLGGPDSFLSGPGAQIVNNSGTFVGEADTSIPHPYPDANGNPFIRHAIKWQHGVVTDLGALPGGGSSGTVWISDSGIIAGGSQTGAVDRLTGFLASNAVLWNKGQIMDLGTLGGSFSLAVCVNNKRQAVGFGDNGIADPFSDQFSGIGTGTQTRAFLWQNGVMQDLGTLGGPDAMAVYVNERGQVAGNALTNSTPNPDTGSPTIDPFLWEDGRMIDLGGFGGTLGFANALNDRGQVVGQSNLQGNQAFHPFLWNRGTMKDLGTLGGNYGVATVINDTGSVVGWATPTSDEEIHGFLWMHGTMTDLGTLDGDPCNFPNSINARGQVVGQSNACQDPNQPFLWENGGPMVNLNDLIVPGSQINMRVPQFINDRGEIGGFGRLPNDDFRAVLLIPCDGNQGWNHPDDRQCDAIAGNAPAGSQGNLSPAPQPVSKEVQAKLVRETLDDLRTQPGRYRGVGARPHR